MTVACSDPNNTACGQWKVRVGIPPSLQQPGQLARTFLYGTLELVTLSSQEVTGIFSNTSTFQVDVNGPFTAPRCP